MSVGSTSSKGSLQVTSGNGLSVSNGVVSMSKGNASIYGSTKLSDTYNSSVSGGNAAGGLGASQNALYNAYNDLNTSMSNFLKNKPATLEDNDANNAGSGLYMCSNATGYGKNFPNGIYGCYLLSIIENSDWGGQILWSRDTLNKLFIRSLNNGVWSDWTEK